MNKKVIGALAGASFSYGWCRGWTLPIWDYKKDMTSRLGIAFCTGFMYTIPPFCFIKYKQLCSRLYRRHYGLFQNDNDWREFEFFHPRIW